MTISRILLTVAILTASTSAFAEVREVPASGFENLDAKLFATMDSSSDQFSELKKMFSAAPAATEAEVMGWMSGRCYHYDAPTVPLANLLVGVKKQIEGDNGPLFPPKYASRFFAMSTRTKEAADYFDDLSDKTKVEVTALIDSEFDTRTDMEVKAGSLTVLHEEGNIEFGVRKSNDYLIMKAILKGNDGNLKSGDIFAMCYFFKKLK